MSTHPEINSLEWHSLLVSQMEEGRDFAQFDFVSTSPMVVRLRTLEKIFLINDDPPNTNRKRPIEELLRL